VNQIVASRTVRAIRSRLFHGVLNDWQAYHAVVEKSLLPGMRVLDVGCGRGAIAPFPWRSFPLVHLDGLDPDSTAAANPHLRRFYHMGDAPDWPVEESAYDLVLARYVLEHVRMPPVFFGNVSKALKPGGRFIFLTPNLRHPAVKVSRVLSHRAKERILGATQGVAEDDIFPTHYLANTTTALRSLADAFKLEVESLDASEFQPIGYLDFNAVAFLPALAFYAAVRPLRALDRRFGAAIIGVMRKPPTTPSPHSIASSSG
jgi:2-polyprenyl-3-methyl-5-hydroxy-6-metoxy-1,4-benzoquinol methylase